MFLKVSQVGHFNISYLMLSYSFSTICIAKIPVSNVQPK